MREAWKILEPHAVFVENWHIHAICDHLEAVTDGRITRLLINVPPGSMKSLLVSVFWQAWEWGPMGRPSLRYVATAFNDGPIERDASKFLNLIKSDWYKALWPEIELKREAIDVVENTATGDRRGIAFGSLTSQRGDRLVIDDPHSTTTAESDVERNKVTRNFREGVLNRLNSQTTSAIVVIMQRLHAEDLSGIILKFKMPFVHLMLPMEFEPARCCRTSIGFVDPRTADGELLDPVRWPLDAWETYKRGTTEYAIAGQYQQRPVPREGGLFKRHWFAERVIAAAPSGTKWVRHWDLAASKRKTAARTAGVKLGRTPDGRYVIGHAIATREEGNEVRKIIKATAETDGKDVEISLPQDPGQGGKVQVQDYVAMLAGFIVFARPERADGDKFQRAEPFSAQCAAGNVSIVRGDWNDDYLDELCSFPGGSFKDQVDATSGAFARLLADLGAPIAAPIVTGVPRVIPGQSDGIVIVNPVIQSAAR